MALAAGKPFAPIRKKGKLPGNLAMICIAIERLED
jgi:adenine/guanine phosphoribosyltransferase-like PRPP-binding protein